MMLGDIMHLRGCSNGWNIWLSLNPWNDHQPRHWHWFLKNMCLDMGVGIGRADVLDPDSTSEYRRVGFETYVRTEP